MISSRDTYPEDYVSHDYYRLHFSSGYFTVKGSLNFVNHFRSTGAFLCRSVILPTVSSTRGFGRLAGGRMVIIRVCLGACRNTLSRPIERFQAMGIDVHDQHIPIVVRCLNAAWKLI